jgi:MAC/Perforin domain
MKNVFMSRLVSLLTLLALIVSCPWPGSEDRVNDPAILTGMDLLGRGYDVFSNYADPKEVKAEVLDFDAMYNAGLIERIQLEDSDFQTIEGTKVEDYMSTLSQKASVGGSYAGFSGSVTVNFDESHYNHSEYSFATVETLIRKYSARIDLGASAIDLKSYLTNNSHSVINNPLVDPESVFISFGTHVLRGIVIGGRLDYNVSADMSLVEGTKSIGVFAEASYEGIFSVDVSSETVSASEMSSFNSVRKKSLKVYGGSSEYGQYIIAENEAGYAPWIESIRENPVFCDFDRTTPIIPIWDLCDDPTRAAALESGYEAYAQKRAIDPTDPTPTSHACIVDIKLYDLTYGYSGPNPTADGFVLLPQDLNEGAGGNFIYVLVKYGLDTDTSPAPVTNIYVRNASYGDPVIPGFIQPTGFCDLNHNAGGDDIFLYFARGGTQVIRSVATKNTSDSRYYYSKPGTFTFNDDEGRTYTWVDDRDLNRNAGGDDIFLGWSYDLVD